MKTQESVSENTLQDKLKHARILEALNRAELKARIRISQILINVAWEFTGLVAKLNPDDVLVVNYDGEIFKGKNTQVKSEKMTKLKEKLPGRKSLEIDSGGLPEYLATKSWVTSQTTPMRNAWESVALKPPKESDCPIVDLFEEHLAEVEPSEVYQNHYVGLHHKYTEIFIKNYPTGVGISDVTNKILYYIYEGKRLDFEHKEFRD